MLGRPGPHQLCGGAVSDPSRRLAGPGNGAGAIFPLSLSAFSQDASALAESLCGIRAGKCGRAAAGGMDCGQLHAGKAQSLAGQSWAGRQLFGDLHDAHAFSLPVVGKLTIAPDVFLWREKFSPLQQKHLLDDVMVRLKQAPLYRPVMPKTGKAFSVEESNFGQLGWVADKSGYRYQPAHPVTGAPWPDIPQALLDLWAEINPGPGPQCCLVNF